MLFSFMQYAIRNIAAAADDDDVRHDADGDCCFENHPATCLSSPRQRSRAVGERSHLRHQKVRMMDGCKHRVNPHQ